MENNPKKSKAFIITLIIVLILLFVGYYLYKNKDTIFATKGSTSIGQIFSPLLGKPKATDLTTITTPVTQSVTDTATTTGDNNPNPTDVSNVVTGSGLSSLNLNPLPTPGQNNNTNNSSGTYTNPTDTGAGTTPDTIPTTIDPSVCPVDDPLSNYFTDAEKTQLDALLRKFYLLAPSLRTQDDINYVIDEKQKNTALLEQIKSLIVDCNNQISDPNYTGPKTTKDNEYYSGNSTYADSNYLPETTPPIIYTENGIKVGNYSLFEKLFNIW